MSLYGPITAVVFILSGLAALISIPLQLRELSKRYLGQDNSDLAAYKRDHVPTHHESVADLLENHRVLYEYQEAMRKLSEQIASQPSKRFTIIGVRQGGAAMQTDAGIERDSLGGKDIARVHGAYSFDPAISELRNEWKEGLPETVLFGKRGASGMRGKIEELA